MSAGRADSLRRPGGPHGIQLWYRWPAERRQKHLFNALTQSENAEAANYPFCTIDPNSGLVNVPDPRLWVLQKIVATKTVIPTQLELVDIAGLVKGASEGAGQGMPSSGTSRVSMRSCMWCAASRMTT